MKLLLTFLFRNVNRRSSFDLRRISAYSTSIPSCSRNFTNFNSSSTRRLFSTKNEDGDDGKEKKSSKDEKTAKVSENIENDDNAVKLKLTKAGGFGNAGELRKIRESEERDPSSKDEKKKRPPKTDAKKDDSSTSDDELMSSSSSSSDDDPGPDKDKKSLGKEKEKEKDKPSELLTSQLRHAVKDVSKSLGGDVNRTRSELLKKLMAHEKESYEASKIQEAKDADEGDEEAGKKKSAPVKKKGSEKSPSSKLGSLIGEMKVDKWKQPGKDSTEVRRKPRREMMRASDQLVHRYKKIVRDEEEDDSGERPPRSSRKDQDEQEIKYERTDFFDRGPGLEIFGPVKDKLKASSAPLLPVWENLERRRLKQLTSREPRNGFEEFIRWTEEGKMHPYPIDNDYGHYEVNVAFHEHVFLEHLLDDGFPTSGPIRHFMELVVHGLSSNPFMTVEKKHGHIAWFRDYFKQRGAEIEKLHALDLKHQQALAEIEAAADAGSAKTQPPVA